ncbi:hypothetical protein GCM10018966_061750 [Streptomyces yanii]
MQGREEREPMTSGQEPAAGVATEGVVDDISHEGLRILLREEGVTFQRLKTWKASKGPDYTVKKARVEHLYAIADGEVLPEPGEPEAVFRLDEFGPLNLQPHPAGNGPNAAAGTRPPTANRGAADARRTAAPTGSGTCSPLMTWARTSSTATSSRGSTARGSWSSAATCAAFTRPRPASRSCSTTSPRT